MRLAFPVFISVSRSRFCVLHFFFFPKLTSLGRKKNRGNAYGAEIADETASKSLYYTYFSSGTKMFIWYFFRLRFQNLSRGQVATDFPNESQVRVWNLNFLYLFAKDFSFN